MNYFNCPAETLSNRIVSTGMKRMTLHQPAESQEHAARDAIALDCLSGVLRARRFEPAGLRKHRRDETLIRANGANGDGPHDRILERSRFTSASTPAYGALTNSRFALITRSTPSPRPSALLRRNASRKSLRHRLRSTDEPTFRVTVNPIRGLIWSDSTTNAVNNGVWNFRPEL